jgi:hypothetical protein
MVVNMAGRTAADLGSVLEQQSLTTGIIGRTRAGRAAPQGRPGAARPGWGGHQGGAQGSTVLTDLLTTTLDHPGHRWTEKSGDQGRCDRLDSDGRL